MKFGDTKNSAPFPSMVVVFKLVRIHRFSIAEARKFELRDKHNSGGSEVGNFFISQPISKRLPKTVRKIYIYEEVPNMDVVNHLGVGFCQVFWGGHTVLLICSFEFSHRHMTISTYTLTFNNIQKCHPQYFTIQPK